jgi:hypothetical protein
MRTILGLGQHGILPVNIALGIFISALTYLIAIRKAPGGVAAA